VWRLFRVFKTAHWKVADFREGRTRQPDHAFLADCGVEPETEAARIAIAVRRAVAGVGLVDPLFVRAGDSYPGTLELLPLWDSMDWFFLQSEIERELGDRMRWQPSENVPRSGSLSVGDMVASVRDLLERSRIAEAGAAEVKMDVGGNG
jgi:hypothetical protein